MNVITGARAGTTRYTRPSSSLRQTGNNAKNVISYCQADFSGVRVCMCIIYDCVCMCAFVFVRLCLCLYDCVCL